jgi:hypothetical protein
LEVVDVERHSVSGTTNQDFQVPTNNERGIPQAEMPDPLLSFLVQRFWPKMGLSHLDNVSIVKWHDVWTSNFLNFAYGS